MYYYYQCVFFYFNALCLLYVVRVFLIVCCDVYESPLAVLVGGVGV
jgi:hypothetical protein